jgi:hypothetical protein
MKTLLLLLVALAIPALAHAQDEAAERAPDAATRIFSLK